MHFGLNWPLKPLVLSDQLNVLTNPALPVVSGVQGQDPIIVESPLHLTNRNRKLNQKPVNQKAVFIPSGRGNAFLQDEQGYYYMKNRTSEKDNTIYWRCRVKRKFKCPVKVTTKGFNITLITHEHNHKIIPLWKTKWTWVVWVDDCKSSNLWTCIWQWHLIRTITNLS